MLHTFNHGGSLITQEAFRSQKQADLMSKTIICISLLSEIRAQTSLEELRPPNHYVSQKV